MNNRNNRQATKINLEPPLVIQGKSEVAKKALSELIATKWKSVNRMTGTDKALLIMANAIANKGRRQQVRTEEVQVETFVEHPKQTVNVVQNTYRPSQKMPSQTETVVSTSHSRMSKGRRTNTARNVVRVSSKVVICFYIYYFVYFYFI